LIFAKTFVNEGKIACKLQEAITFSFWIVKMGPNGPNGLLRAVSPRGGWVGRRKDVKYLNETAARSLIPKACAAQ